MSNREHFPTMGEMKQQYPMVKAMLDKELPNESLSSTLIGIIKTGIFIFIVFSFFALGMQNGSVSDNWSSMDVSFLVVMTGFFLMFVIIGFIISVGGEALQGTFKTLSLYPIGINSIITSKLVYIAFIGGTFTATILLCALAPMLIGGVISMRLASYYIVIAALMFFSHLLITAAGAFYANIPASSGRGQQIPSYTFLAFCIALLATYWPMRMIFTMIFRFSDPDDRFVSEDTAIGIANAISHLSPFDMAFHLSRHYILGSALDPGYFVCIPLWFFIAFIGIRAGPRVYMDIFFRRG